MSFDIQVADPTGFCFGVKRAVDKAVSLAGRQETFTLGPLIHNAREVDRLARQGIRPVKTLEGVPPGSTVIIRTHGAPPEIYREAERAGVEILDLTCPFVRVVRQKVGDLEGEGYQAVVVGDPEHPEVKAVLAWARGEPVVVANAGQAEKVAPDQRLGVVFQTTYRRQAADEVVTALESSAREVRVEDTICDATAVRQTTARDLAREMDVMVVVGGKNSSNTLKLAEVCRDEGAETYHVERGEEIQSGWFDQADRVGVVAGASTPEWIIREVVNVMEEFKERPEESREEEEEKQEEIEETAEETVEEGPEPKKPEEAEEEETPAAEDEEPEEAEEEEAEEPEEEPQEEPVAAEAVQDEETEEAEEEEEESQESLMAQEEALDFSLLRAGDLLEGTVVQISEEGVLVDVSYKSEGLIPPSELYLGPGQKPEDVLEVGEKVDVYVLSVDGQDGGVLLSQRRAAQELAWEVLKDAYHEGRVVEAPVEEEVKGGLVLNVGVRGFMPASHVSRGFERDLSQYVGERMKVRVIELDRHKNRVILSRKVVLEKEYQSQREETMKALSEGEVKKGVVKGVTDFGAFVDLGGVDGLLHVSEMSWGRVEHPSDVVKEGDEIEVMVLRVDHENDKVSLGLKQLQPDPWDTVDQKYPVGATVKGKVMRLAPFGAFVQLEPGVEGLVHISQLSDRHVEEPSEAVSEGDEVMVKILKVQPRERRISLSVRDAHREAQVFSDSGSVTLGEVFGDLLKETKTRLSQSRARPGEEGQEEEEEENKDDS